MIECRGLPAFSGLLVGGLLAAVLLLGGCASTKPPPPELTTAMRTARDQINQAREAGGQEYAPLVLRSAEQKMDDAQLATAERKYDRAQYLVEQARTDARLAEVTALSAKTQQAARELQESIRALRQEIERKRKN